MARSAAIIVQDNALALIKRQREGNTYFVFPGGGVEPGETPEQAAVREVYEELGVEITVERLAAEVSYVHSGHDRTHQFYFLAHITGGRFGTGQGPEMLGLYPAHSGTYAPVWLPVGQLKSETVYPVSLVELVCGALETGWPGHVVQLSEAI